MSLSADLATSRVDMFSGATCCEGGATLTMGEDSPDVEADNGVPPPEPRGLGGLIVLLELNNLDLTVARLSPTSRGTAAAGVEP